MPPKTKSIPPPKAGRRGRTTAVDLDRDPEDPPPPFSRPGAHRTMAAVVASKGLADRAPRGPVEPIGDEGAPVHPAGVASRSPGRRDEADAEAKDAIRRERNRAAPPAPAVGLQIVDAGHGDDFVENVSFEEKRRRRKEKKKRRHKEHGRRERGRGREEDDRGAISKADVRGSTMAATAAGSTKKSGTSFDERLRTKLKESRDRETELGVGAPLVGTRNDRGRDRGGESGDGGCGSLPGLGVSAPTAAGVATRNGRPADRGWQPQPPTAARDVRPRTTSGPDMLRLSTLSSKETDEESLRTSLPPLEATLVQSVEATLIVDENARSNNDGASDTRDPNRVSVDSPVYEAMPISEVADKTWWKKHRRYVIVGAGCLALGAMGATIGLLAGALNDGSDDDGTRGGVRGPIGNLVTGAPSGSPLTAAPSANDFAGGTVPSSPSELTGGALLPPPPPTPAEAGDAAPARPGGPADVGPPPPDGLESTTIMPVPFPAVEPVDDVLAPAPSSLPPPSPPTFQPTPEVVATAATTTTTATTVTTTATTTTKTTLAAGPVKQTLTPATANSEERVIMTGALDAIAAGGSQSLQFSYGCVFNVRTKPDVAGDVLLTGLDFYTKSTEDVEFELWTREGTFVGFKGSYDGWNPVASGTVLGRGTGGYTPVPDKLFDPVSIPGGGGEDGVRAFYLTLTTQDLLYKLGDGVSGSGSSLSDARAHAETAELEVWEGEGVLGYPFPDLDFHYRSPRQFVGAIFYTVR